MALVTPTKEFQSPTLSWTKENSNSFSVKQRLSESSSLVPRIVTNEQLNPLFPDVHVRDTISPGAVKYESQQSTSNLHSKNDHAARYSTQSFNLLRKVDEKDQKEEQRRTPRLANANFTRVRRVPVPNVTRVKESPNNTLLERSHSESLPRSKGIFGNDDIPLANFRVRSLSPLNRISNEHPLLLTNFHPENIRAAKHSSGSFSSLKSVDEKEQKDQLITTTPSKQFSYLKRPSVTVYHKRKNSSILYPHTGDLIPLDPTINENQHNVHTIKYNFQSPDSMKIIYGKQEDNNRRTVVFFHWQNSYCYRALGCLFAIVACSIGIAALIFALISYHNTLPATIITTTSTTTTTTSTTSTTTTTTTTTTDTTTSTSTITTTSTSTTTTSTTSTSATTMCSTTSMTTIVTIAPLPSQCSSYMSISDATRLSSYTGGVVLCDQTLFSSPTWVRFTGGGGGISLANCPVAVQYCGANSTGWYSGVYPAIAGDITDGVVCYNWALDTCSWQNYIHITNCNGYYVYKLSAPPICNARYCTM